MDTPPHDDVDGWIKYVKMIHESNFAWKPGEDLWIIDNFCEFLKCSVPEPFWENDEFVRFALELSSFYALQVIPHRFQDDPRLISTAFERTRNGELLQFASPRLRGDR